MGEATDRDLWQRAVSGEAECFGVLFDRHAEAVRGYCARRTGSIDDADDLVSIVFLEAWRRRASVELVDHNALPWLYGVARRTIQHRWRTTTRHRRALARLPREVTGDHAEDVVARVDDQRHLAEVRQAFHGLNPIDQDVLLVCVWQHLDYASASVALGVPIGTVRSRLARARARLRAATDRATASPDPSPNYPTLAEER
jgi:RNA polymerase sigma-70 factor (ECF subfamily)